MAKAGLPVHGVRLGDPNYCDVTGNAVECAVDYLKANEYLDAVVCYELSEAIAIHAAARELRRKMPEALDICVFHERETHADIGLVMNTVIIPFREVGQCAADLLMASVEGHEDAQPMAIPYTRMHVAASQRIVPLITRPV